MTTYATRAQLGVYGTSAAALTAHGDTAAQDSELEAASRLIDGYVGARYPTPLSGYGLDVTRATCVIAAYHLFSAGSFDSPDEGGGYRKRYDDVLAWLKAVRAGDTDLAGVAVPGAASGDPSAPVVLSDDPRGWDD